MTLRWPACLVGAALVSWAAGCDRSSPRPQSHAVSSSASEPQVVQRLRAEWESHPDRHKGKDEYSRATEALGAMLTREVEAGGLDDVQRFVEDRGAQPDPEELVTELEERLIR